MYPGNIAMSKVNWKAKNDFEYIINWKLLQLGFSKKNINKPIEMERLCKCKYVDNVEFA
jgi:RP/EB family microtubule-associated protein